MIYFSCAFKSEAQVLINRYKLKKEPPLIKKSSKDKKDISFSLFSSKDIKLIISKIGQINSKIALELLLENYPNEQNDIFVNLGTCAAQTRYDIGELLQIKQLKNSKNSYNLKTLNSNIKKASCFSSWAPVNSQTATDIADMEAISLYETVCDSFKPEKITFLKIVSDHFNPVIQEKSHIIELMQKKISSIEHHLKMILQKDTI